MTNDHRHGSAVMHGLREPARALRAAIPDVYAGFSAMSGAAFADDALDGLTKELIAIGIAVGQQCDGCIASHARGAAKRGATPQQVAEAIGVAIVIAGGPATVYGPRAYAAFLEFHEKYGSRA
jgi:AhpD family alkylhydroperoxidase